MRVNEGGGNATLMPGRRHAARVPDAALASSGAVRFSFAEGAVRHGR